MSVHFCTLSEPFQNPPQDDHEGDMQDALQIVSERS
jgi:hypothetical protein